MIKVLNLYAGIGGNRKLWPDKEIVVTAVELDPKIAEIYKHFFPNDTVVVADAHQYLLEHFKEFDFIWSSPPCSTHSRINTLLINGKGIKPRFPDMKLYEEVIFLQHFCKVPWVVENVKSYYNPLIIPYISGRHYYWSNFNIPDLGKSNKVRNDKGSTLNVKMKDRNIIVNDFCGYKKDKRTLLNNCVEPEIGLMIFNLAFNDKQVRLDVSVGDVV